ncbi:hypothetical protein F4859DRAFT_522844 [Xylaria cf. heliscus]|nr:hypothetical protein F4859DRAFT_522844 [Xylaria cf. heliscus]
MENDMKQQGVPLSPSFNSRIASISKHLINRSEAQKWALMDIKFLIYDDTDVKINGYDSDDEEGMTEYAMRMSTQNDQDGHDNHAGEAPQPGLSGCNKGSGPSSRGNGNNDRDDEFECRVCSACPEFPHNRKTRKFRLFRPTDALPELYQDPNHIASVDICAHYAAVSYCWPALQDSTETNKGATYQIRELDGSVRKSRALDDVLDRAVDVANSCGLRMIWIDQECLPQPKAGSSDEEKHEQQLGIQAMDIVYHRAIITAGLHDVAVTDPLQMSAIQTIMNMDDRMPTNPVTGDTVNHVLHFLKSLLEDRWYTRAWVAQEALSAGPGLMIILRRGPGVAYSAKLRGDRKRYLTPKHTLDHSPRGMPSEVICLPVNEFRSIIRNLKLTLQRNFISNGQTLQRFSNQSHDLIAGVGRVLEAAEALHPRLARQNSSNGIIHTVGRYNYGTRWTVDAAGALTLLKTRDCRDKEDLVAIVANMCGFEIRLDTRAVGEYGSLREGLTALALLNGDLSLLVPEAYGSSNSEFIHSSPQAAEPDPAWMFPLDRYPSEIDHVTVRNFNLHRLPVPPSLTEKGISLPSYVWQVDDQIDLFPIKYQYQDIWEKLKCLSVIIDRLEKETPEQFLARKRLVTNHFSERAILQQAKEDLFLKPELPSESKAWGNINTAGVRVTQYTSAYRIQEVPWMQQIVSEIIFSTLRFLYNSGETDPRAYGLATSIWQSLRVDIVDGREDLPDVVDEKLFEHPAVIASPFRTLQLDIDRNGVYSQLWFVDRIMRYGTLWIGRYKRCHSAQTVSSPPHQPRLDRTSLQDEPQTDKKEEAEESSVDLKGKNRMPIKSPIEASGPEGVPISTSILRRQLRRTIQVEYMDFLAPMGLQGAPNMNAGTMNTFAEVMTAGLWEAEAEEGRISNLTSIFDVDGVCTVMTPYNTNWEMLPRPALRSMSVCWVIKPVGPDNEELADSVTVPLEAKDAVGPNPGASSSETVSMADGKTTDWNKRVHRVTKKVRGLWQLMDPPSPELFITVV